MYLQIEITDSHTIKGKCSLKNTIQSSPTNTPKLPCVPMKVACCPQRSLRTEGLCSLCLHRGGRLQQTLWPGPLRVLPAPWAPPSRETITLRGSTFLNRQTEMSPWENGGKVTASSSCLEPRRPPQKAPEGPRRHLGSRLKELSLGDNPREILLTQSPHLPHCPPSAGTEWPAGGPCAPTPGNKTAGPNVFPDLPLSVF